MAQKNKIDKRKLALRIFVWALVIIMIASAFTLTISMMLLK